MLSPLLQRTGPVGGLHAPAPHGWFQAVVMYKAELRETRFSRGTLLNLQASRDVIDGPLVMYVPHGDHGACSSLEVATLHLPRVGLFHAWRRFEK